MSGNTHRRRRKKRDKQEEIIVGTFKKLKLNDSNSHGDVLMVQDSDEDDQQSFKIEIECSCCYIAYPPSQLKHCGRNIDHLVCLDCLNHFVSEEVDGKGCAEFNCIAKSDCGGNYNQTLLDGILSPKLKKRVNDLIWRENVKRAGLAIWTCPKCAYAGTKEEFFTTIHCFECSITYCTKCNDIEHRGQTCEEYRCEKVSRQDPVHRVNEAQTQAVKRKCPSCGKEFIKSDGCNKITCDCGTKCCYLCREKVESYTHFCQCDVEESDDEEGGNSGCTCGRPCKMFSTPEEMETLERETRRQAREAARKKAVTRTDEADEAVRAEAEGQAREAARKESANCKAMDENESIVGAPSSDQAVRAEAGGGCILM